MKHIKDFQKYNEGFGEIALAGALLGSPSQDIKTEPQIPKEISVVSSRKKKDDINVTIGYLRESSFKEGSTTSEDVYISIIKKLIIMRDGGSVNFTEEESGAIGRSMNEIEYQKERSRKDSNIKHLIERWKGLGEITTDCKKEGEEVIFINNLKFPTRKKGNEPLF